MRVVSRRKDVECYKCSEPQMVLAKMDFGRLSLSFSALIKADKALKSNGADPRLVLEQLIIRLIYIVAKGEAVDKT